MYARRVVPILLIAGGVMMFMHHKRHELMGQSEEGEQHRPIGLHVARTASGASASRRCSKCGTSAPTSRSKRSNRPRFESRTKNLPEASKPSGRLCFQHSLCPHE